MLFDLLLFGILVARFTWSFEAKRFSAKNLIVNGLTLMVAIITILY